MRPAKALERPPCRTGSSPLNDAVARLSDAAGEGAGAPAVPNRVFTSERRGQPSATVRAVVFDFGGVILANTAIGIVQGPM